MAEDIKRTERDHALVNILERMADQIGKQENMLEVVVKQIDRQDDMFEIVAKQISKQDNMLEIVAKQIGKQDNMLEVVSKQIDRQDDMLEAVVKRQDEYTREAQSVSRHTRALQNETENSIDKLLEAVTRYRSDMLSLVNEQDNINRNVSELNKLIFQTAYQFDFINKKLLELDERTKIHERLLSEKSDSTLRQAEQIQRDIFDASRKEANRHAETEKRLGEMQQETQKQLEKLQKDTTRRLLVLGDLESSMQTLLVRTEPQEKAPLLVVRIARRVKSFSKRKLTRILRLLSKITRPKE